MPRKSKKSSNSSTGLILGLAGGILFVLLTATVSAFLIFGGGFSSERKARVTASGELSLSEYLDNANALRGNAYRLNGRVEEQLRWTPDRGRLISLEAGEGSSSSPVPVLVPQTFSHVNIEKGSRFQLMVEVGANGLLIAQDITPE